MTGACKLNRPNARDEDVQHQRGGPDERGREAAKCHHRDVAGGAGVTDGRIEERDNRDPDEEDGDREWLHFAEEETFNVQRSTSNV